MSDLKNIFFKTKIESYDYITTLQSGTQTKSYVLKTCNQSFLNGLGIEKSFYDQWNYLPPKLYDFVQLGQFASTASLVFDHIDYRLFLPFTTSTTLSIRPEIYTPSQLLQSIRSFITTSLSGWNLTATITADSKLQFFLGGIPPSNPQSYVSRTIYAPRIADLSPPLNLNPIYMDTYNMTSWGFNYITQQIPKEGGSIVGQNSLRSVTLVAPQTLYVPYQRIASGRVISTFYSLIPSEANWVEGCLAVQANVQLGTQRDISISTGGLFIAPIPETIWTPTSLCIMIVLGLFTLSLESSIYIKMLALLSIILGIISLTKQSSERSELHSSPGVWNSQGHLIYTPFSQGLQSNKFATLLLKS